MTTAKRFRDKIRNEGNKHIEELFGVLVGRCNEPSISIPPGISRDERHNFARARLKEMREHDVILFPNMSKENRSKLLYIEEE